MDMKGKNVVLGVTGGIAAYRAADIARALTKRGAAVYCILTRNALNFITRKTMETLTGNPAVVDMFERPSQWEVEHIALAKRADVFLVAPASANFLGKVAAGVADDMLTTTVMATRAPIVVAPAMNTNMYENPIVQDNLKILQVYGYGVVDPAVGYLACGDTGAGKMVEPDVLLDVILQEIAYEKDLAGLKILVTAGPTQEAVDPVRYITNHSTGKMGYAIAKIASRRGAEVTLVSGPTAEEEPAFVNVVNVCSAKEMFEAVKERAQEQDIIIKAAAVADYRPKHIRGSKMKKTEDGSDLTLELERTDDILAYLGAHKKQGQFLCGFAMETEDLIANAKRKLEKKRLDMIAANSLRVEGAGFGGNTNVVTVITKEKEVSLGKMTKEETAAELLTMIAEARKV